MKIKIKDFVVLRNNRTSPVDFAMDNPCHFCDNYSDQVICIPYGWGMIQVCGTCLHSMIERLNENMVDNFQKDFENREEIPEKCCLCGGIRPDNLCCEI